MSKCTIARGLKICKRLQGRIAERAARLSQISSRREDQVPAFDFETVLSEHDQAVSELGDLREKIAVANATTHIELDGREVTLAAAIRQLSELKGRKALFERVSLRTGSERETINFDDRGRPVTQEVTWKAVWTEPERAKKLEELQERMALLDELIEETNHTTFLSV